MMTAVMTRRGFDIPQAAGQPVHRRVRRTGKCPRCLETPCPRCPEPRHHALHHALHVSAQESGWPEWRFAHLPAVRRGYLSGHPRPPLFDALVSKFKALRIAQIVTKMPPPQPHSDIVRDREKCIY